MNLNFRLLRRKGFTLIELLVVIAIISILAGILLPVLMQAKNSAKLAQCVSGIRQIGMAHKMYENDNEDRMITTHRDVYNYCSATAGDACMRLAPYIKNYQIWFCPDRVNRPNPYSAAPCFWNTKNYLLGYGSNSGVWSISDTTGMYYNPSSSSAMIGYTTSEVEEPSRFIVQGQTNDYPYYTLSMYFQATEGVGNQFLRHQGRWPYIFSDGHAKSLFTGPYAVTGSTTWTILLKKEEDMQGFCIQQGHISTDYNITCNELVRRIIQYRVPK